MEGLPGVLPCRPGKPALPGGSTSNHPALASLVSADASKPAKGSISWKLWEACHDIAEQALATDYIQGIKNGTLDPNSAGQYTVQDAVSCAHASGDYKELERRALFGGDPELAAFARALYDGNVKYNAETFEQWHIRDAGAIAPSRAAETYIHFEHEIASRWPPIYGVVGMIPRDPLWAYLATKLESHATTANLYSFWITENDDWSGAYRLDGALSNRLSLQQAPILHPAYNRKYPPPSRANHSRRSGASGRVRSTRCQKAGVWWGSRRWASSWTRR